MSWLIFIIVLHIYFSILTSLTSRFSSLFLSINYKPKWKHPTLILIFLLSLLFHLFISTSICVLISCDYSVLPLLHTPFDSTQLGIYVFFLSTMQSFSLSFSDSFSRCYFPWFPSLHFFSPASEILFLVIFSQLQTILINS